MELFWLQWLVPLSTISTPGVRASSTWTTGYSYVTALSITANTSSVDSWQCWTLHRKSKKPLLSSTPFSTPKAGRATHQLRGLMDTGCAEQSILVTAMAEPIDTLTGWRQRATPALASCLNGLITFSAGPPPVWPSHCGTEVPLNRVKFQEFTMYLATVFSGLTRCVRRNFCEVSSASICLFYFTVVVLVCFPHLRVLFCFVVKVYIYL